MEEKKFCQFCGAELQENTQFCNSCGKSVNNAPAQVVVVQGKKKNRALRLAIFSLVLSALAIFFVIINTSTVLSLIFLIPSGILAVIAFLVNFFKNRKSLKKAEFIVASISLGIVVVLLAVFAFGTGAREKHEAERQKQLQAETEENRLKRNYENVLIEMSEYEYSFSTLDELKELAEKDYKASKMLLFYDTFYKSLWDAKNDFRAQVKANLKDPDSFNAVSNNDKFTMNLNGDSVKVIYTISETYTATNSFGGRVKNSYGPFDSAEYTIPLNGLSYDDVKDIGKMSLDDLLEKYDK